MGIVLTGPGVYVPREILTNNDLANLRDSQDNSLVIETNDEWIKDRTGISQRRVSQDMGVREMGIEALEDLEEILGKSLNPQEVRLATNRHSEGEFPCYAAKIASHMGLKDVVLQDNLAGCTGLVYAIRDAYNAINSGEIESSLVVGSERLTDFINFGDRNTCVLFGDGAGAYLLEKKDGKEGIIANVLGGDPDVGGQGFPHGYLTIRPSMGKKIKKNFQGEWEAYDFDGDYVVMNGQEVFKFATEVMRRAVHDVLHKGKYSLEDVDVIIPHGANMRIIDAANKGLVRKGFRGKVFTNMDRFGNTSTASIPISTAQAIKDGVIKDGSLVVNVSFGAGFTYGANLYRASIEGDLNKYGLNLI